jgi:predicted PurR-regulated permease PerM
VMLFTMFYFFIDGERILNRLRYLSPVRDEYQNIILNRFLLISRATIVGTILIGIIQGSFGAITLLVFGIKSWLLWGFIMVVLAIIPMAGTWIVLIPAGIIQIITGNLWRGIGIILTSIIIVSNIDNLIRPRIVGYGAKMHDLLIFFSTLGGLSLFGVTGFIVGPIIASFFITMVDIYELEFHSNQELFDKHE